MGHQIQEFKTHMHPHRVNGEITFMMSIIFRDPFRIYDIIFNLCLFPLLPLTTIEGERELNKEMLY